MEFYEDFYANNKKAVDTEDLDDEDVQFVTGADAEFDQLEKRLSEGGISPEELDAELDSWINGDQQAAPPIDPELGDGFSDDYRGP